MWKSRSKVRTERQRPCPLRAALLADGLLSHLPRTHARSVAFSAAIRPHGMCLGFAAVPCHATRRSALLFTPHNLVRRSRRALVSGERPDWAAGRRSSRVRWIHCSSFLFWPSSFFCPPFPTFLHLSLPTLCAAAATSQPDVSPYSFSCSGEASPLMTALDQGDHRPVRPLRWWSRSGDGTGGGGGKCLSAHTVPALPHSVLVPQRLCSHPFVATACSLPLIFLPAAHRSIERS